MYLILIRWSLWPPLLLYSENKNKGTKRAYLTQKITYTGLVWPSIQKLQYIKYEIYLYKNTVQTYCNYTSVIVIKGTGTGSMASSNFWFFKFFAISLLVCTSILWPLQSRFSLKHLSLQHFLHNRYKHFPPWNKKKFV